MGRGLPNFATLLTTANSDSEESLAWVCAAANETPNDNPPSFRVLDSYTVGVGCVLDVVRRRISVRWIIRLGP